MAITKWETGEYVLKSGIFKFRFWYESTGIDVTTPIDLNFTNINPIKIPLDILPGENYQFSSMDITFRKNTIIENMITNVKSSSKEASLFFDVLKGSDIIWRGCVDFADIKKSDWYISDSSFTYRKMTIKINDALWYFNINREEIPFSLLNGGFKLVLGDFVEYICGKIGLTYPDDVEVYNADDFLDDDFLDTAVVKNGFSTDLFLFIKDLMLAFGVYVFFLNGKLRIASKVDATEIITATSDKFWNINKENDQNEDISYLEISCKLDVLNPGNDSPGKILKMAIGSDEETLPAYKQISYRLSDAFGQWGEVGSGVEETLGKSSINTVSRSVVSEYDDGNWSIVTDPDADVGDVADFQIITFTNNGFVDFTDYAKKGYFVDLYESDDTLILSGPIVSVDSATQIKMMSQEISITGAVYYRIRKNDTVLAHNYRNMCFDLFEQIYDRYVDYIGNPVYRFSVKGLVLDPNVYVMMTKSYRVRYFSLDLVKNKTLLKAHELGSDYNFYNTDYYDPNYYE